MDYRKYLFSPLSRHYVDLLVLEIFANPSDFELVYQLIFDPDKKIAWRAAWACQKISEKHPEWFNDTHFNELSILSVSTSHGGLLRGCLSVLNNIPLPNPIPVEFINACFEWMVSPKSPVSVQALSMKMLLRICTLMSDFKPELMAHLENTESGTYSAGFNSTRKNVLKTLNSK